MEGREGGGLRLRREGFGGAAAERGRKGPGGGREGVRGGAPRHVGVAEAVHRDGDALLEIAAADLNGAPAEIGGIEEGGAGGVELRYEGGDVADERGLEGSHGDREVGRGGGARHVSGTEAGHRDAAPAL